MSVYHEMQKAAMNNVAKIAKGTDYNYGVALLLAAIVYALLAIAGAIADLKP